MRLNVYQEYGFRFSSLYLDPNRKEFKIVFDNSTSTSVIKYENKSGIFKHTEKKEMSIMNIHI